MARKKKNTEEAVATVATPVLDGIVEHKSADGADFNVRPYLSISEQMEFVDFVCGSMFLDGEYRPEMFDFAMKCAIVSWYTDIALPTDPEHDPEKLYVAFYCTNLMEAIKEKISYIQQLGHMEAAIWRKMEYIKSNQTNLLTKHIDDFANILKKKLEELPIDKQFFATTAQAIKRLAEVDEVDVAKELVKIKE